MVSRENAWRLIALFILASVGCVASENPLSDEESSTADEDLIGEWILEGDTDEAAMVIQRKEGSQTVLEVVDPNADKSIQLFGANIGDAHYLSFESSVGAVTAYEIIRYEMRDRNTVEWCSLDKTIVAAAIRAGEVKGKIGFWPVITDAPEGIRAYFEKHGKDCFDRNPLVVLKRKKH
jgi:hypothetical protein